MAPDIKSIFSQFQTGEVIKEYMAYGKGHINDTYLIMTEGASNPDYILQRINHQIFENVPELMENISIVTDHIRKKQLSQDGSFEKVTGLDVIKSRDQHDFVRNRQGDYWRCFNFIENAIIFEKVNHPDIAFEAGKAIGHFQAMLSDLDCQLYETLPRFHSFDRRYKEYKQALSNNHDNRADQVGKEIHFIESRIEEMEKYFTTLRTGEIPLRVTHNDTKVNNIIFDEAGHSLCLIDLDTVMPGYIHFDYGDALRTSANTAEEDEPDLSKVSFDFELFSSFTSGYLELARSFLLPKEKELLAFAPRYMTFIIGLRFFTDYLNGDIYFKISEPNHNLRRSRVQFKLLSSIEEQSDKMINFIL